MLTGSPGEETSSGANAASLDPFNCDKVPSGASGLLLLAAA